MPSSPNLYSVEKKNCCMFEFPAFLLPTKANQGQPMRSPTAMAELPSQNLAGTLSLHAVLVVFNPDTTSFLLQIKHSWLILFVSQEHCVHPTSFPTKFEHATLWWQKKLWRGE